MQISEYEITGFISEPYLSRGKEYFKEGLVELLRIHDDSITARAAGNTVYHIKLMRKNNNLSGNCSCPAFSDFGPCKHLAATCFAAIKFYKSSCSYRPSEEYFDRTETYTNIEQKLSRKSRSELQSLILQLTGYYPEILETLEELID